MEGHVTYMTHGQAFIASSSLFPQNVVGCRHISDDRNQPSHRVSVTQKVNSSLTMVY